MKPERQFTGQWSKDEDGFYHLLSGGLCVYDYDQKVLSKLKTMRATEDVRIDENLPSLVKMSNNRATIIYENARLNSLVEMNNEGNTYICAQLNALVKMNNDGGTYITENAQLPLLKKPKAKFVAVWLNGWYGCRISRIRDWDSFYSEFRAVVWAVTEEVSFVQTEEGIELLSPDKFLSFIKLSGV